MLGVAGKMFRYQSRPFQSSEPHFSGGRLKQESIFNSVYVQSSIKQGIYQYNPNVNEHKVGAVNILLFTFAFTQGGLAWGSGNLKGHTNEMDFSIF